DGDRQAAGTGPPRAGRGCRSWCCLSRAAGGPCPGARPRGGGRAVAAPLSRISLRFVPGKRGGGGGGPFTSASSPPTPTVSAALDSRVAAGYAPGRWRRWPRLCAEGEGMTKATACWVLVAVVLAGVTWPGSLSAQQGLP